jgi:hypothetical protein
MSDNRNRNIDTRGNVISAEEEQARHPWERGLTGDDFAHMPYLDPGTELKPGESYLDLNQIEGGPFTPKAKRQVQRGERTVAQRNTDPDLWRKLVGEG